MEFLACTNRKGWRIYACASVLKALRPNLLSLRWDEVNRCFIGTTKADDDFKLVLTSKQLKQLGQELIDLAERHK